MKIPFTILIFLLFPTLTGAQNFQIDKPSLPIDSLKKALPFLNGKARIDCLNELSRSYNETMTLIHADSALLIVSQAYKEASAINYIKGLGDACLRYGVISQWHFFNAQKMEKYFREAIFWYQKVQNDDGLGHAFLGLGTAHLKLFAPDAAKNAFEQSAFHFRKTGNSIMLAELTDQVGVVYNIKGDFEKYFEHVKKTLKERKRIGDNRGMVWSYYRLAHIYQQIGDYETALDFFRHSYQQASSQSMPWKFYRSMGEIFLYLENYDSSIYYFQKMLQGLPDDGPALAGLGKLFMLRKDYDKALDYLQSAAINFKERNNDAGLMGVYIDIGKSYSGLKQYPKALQYAMACLKMAKDRAAKNVMQNAYEIHWNVFEALGWKDSAYFYFQNFVNLKDSLEDAKFKLQYLQKLALYKVEAREEQQQAKIDLLNKDNLIKQQQLQKEALQRKILIGSLAAFALLAFILLRNIMLKHKNEKHRLELAENELQIEKLENEKTKAEWQHQATELEMQALRAQMNPHFIFNSLNSINRFILKEQSSEATAYLTKFSRLIRMILNNSVYPAVSLTEELEALQLYLELESLRFGQKFNYKIHCRPEVDADFIKVPPMLLQPYVENALWHGLMLKEGDGHLWVNISEEESTLICTITDNGIGRKKAAEIKSKSVNVQKSMGMRITANRIALLQQQKKLDTSIKITDLILPDGSAGGTEVVIKIPITYD